MRRALTFFLFFTMFTIIGCRSAQSAGEERILLAFQDKANRCRVHLEDTGVKAFIQPADIVPYSSNASGAVWIGTEIAYEKVQRALEIARRYYKELRYVALSNLEQDPPQAVHRELFIGGDTAAALRLGLKAWGEEDWQQLLKAQSREQFVKVIESKYPAKAENKPVK